MLDMASVDIAGCEFDTSKEADVTPAFATDNFFPLLGVPNGDAGNVTLGQIKMLQSKMTDSILSVEKKGDSTLLHVRSLDGKERYVRLKETADREPHNRAGRRRDDLYAGAAAH